MFIKFKPVSSPELVIIIEPFRFAKCTLENFYELYHDNWIIRMRSKLGIFNKELDDEFLVQELLDIMEKYNADYNNIFVYLTLDKLDESDLFKSEDFKSWNSKWEDRLKRQKESKELSKELMKSICALQIHHLYPM